MNTAFVVTKVDPQTKREAMKTANELGMPLSVVIKSFLKQFIRTKSVFFSANDEIPTKYMFDLIKQSEKDIKSGKTVSFKSPKEELACLNKLTEKNKSN